MPEFQPLTEAQSKFIERTRTACDRAFVLAEEAHQLGLPILAREWNYFGKELSGRVDLQLRAFRDNTLLNPNGGIFG